MEIKKEKLYKVEKYPANGKSTDLGILPGTDVKSILKGYTYDSTFEMWFSGKANIGYDIEEVKE